LEFLDAVLICGGGWGHAEETQMMVGNGTKELS